MNYSFSLDKNRLAIQNWRAPWKNRICSTTMKLRKSLVKPVMRQKTCNYNELFGSSARDRHAGRI